MYENLDGLGSVNMALQDLGIGNMDAIDNPNRYAWDEVVDFNTAIAAGASSGELPFTISNGWHFCVTEIGLAVWNSSTFDTNVPVGTPACMESAGGTAADANDMFFRNNFRLQIKGGSVDFFSKPANASLVSGTVARPAILGVRRWIAAGAQGVATLYNDHASAAVKAALVLKGFRVKNKAPVKR